MTSRPRTPGPDAGPRDRLFDHAADLFERHLRAGLTQGLELGLAQLLADASDRATTAVHATRRPAEG